mmetsp:Transcript_29828/g.68117  ORF Transcript_29828/g.68117 Transcript_29828/m.68117 type:complete len:241 (+) Transcript_29828:955-1677(+)
MGSKLGLVGSMLLPSFLASATASTDWRCASSQLTFSTPESPAICSSASISSSISCSVRRRRCSMSASAAWRSNRSAPSMPRGSRCRSRCFSSLALACASASFFCSSSRKMAPDARSFFSAMLVCDQVVGGPAGAASGFGAWPGRGAASADEPFPPLLPKTPRTSSSFSSSSSSALAAPPPPAFACAFSFILLLASGAAFSTSHLSNSALFRGSGRRSAAATGSSDTPSGSVWRARTSARR